MNPIKTDILILGAGIGGFEAYRQLAKLLHRSGSTKNITLIDQNNYFTFVPMLHEVVSGSIEPSHCTVPLHRIVRAPHKFLRASVKKVNPETQTVETSFGSFTYETCIVALGSGVNYFGIAGAENSYNARSLDSALALRHRLVELLENCDNEIKVVMVGGGYTGAEVAGQIAEFSQKYVARYYPSKKMILSIIESAPTLLAALPPVVQKRVSERLTKMGVALMPGKRVSKIDTDGVHFADGATLASDITIWTAGIQNVAPNFLDEKYCTGGRIAVNDFLQSQQFPSLYAIGDIALFTSPGAERPAPQLGETAHLMGEFVAHHIVAQLKNQTTKPFRFKSLGTLMPIGDWWAVAMVGNFIFFGRLAWWIRRTVYVMFMPGIIYKIKILVDWTLHIFGARDILTTERSTITKK